MPKRASLMGVPVELRLQIYRHIVTRSATDSIECFHCCSWGAKQLASHCDTPNLRTATAILAVNRQMFEEAVPILYSTLEVLFSSKHVLQYAGHHIRKALGLIEDFGLAAGAGVRLVGIPEVSNFSVHYSVPSRDLPKLWRALNTRFPRLEQLRLHIGTSSGVFSLSFDMSLRRADKAALQPLLVQPPCLRNVTLETNKFQTTSSARLLIERLLRIARCIQQEAEKLGRKVVVEGKICGREEAAVKL